MGFIGALILGAIIGIVGALASKTSGENAQDTTSVGSKGGFWKDAGHSRKCDGNCDQCPPHYGYRYGRWYYGHGHQHGCERGGNGGATGKTYRD